MSKTTLLDKGLAAELADQLKVFLAMLLSCAVSAPLASLNDGDSVRGILVCLSWA
jgi:hypothetical protein